MGEPWYDQATEVQASSAPLPPAPRRRLRPTPGRNEAANEGAAVSFQGSATGSGLSYAWAFGDGATTTGTLTPSHVYANSGTYTATPDGHRQPGPDGQQQRPGHRYRGADGHLRGSPGHGRQPGDLHLQQPVQPLHDRYHSGFKYSYDFNNDGTLRISDFDSPTASYTFTNPATTRSTVASPPRTAFTDYYTTVTVTAPAPAPTANAGSNQTAKEGATVSFNGSTTGSGLSYAWAFGDGATTTGTLTPSHVYANSGTYTAT